MSEKKKAQLLKWWSAAKGKGDDLFYYKKSIKMTRIVQGISIVIGTLISALKAVAFLIICTASLSIMAIPAVDKQFFLNDNDMLLRLWRELIPMLCVLFVTGVFVLVVEKKSLNVSIAKKPVRNITFGLVVGCTWVGVSLFSLVFMGRITFDGKSNITYIWVWFVMIMFNVIMQEYLIRGYLFSLIKRDFNTAISIIITTIIFTAMHGVAFEAGIITVLNIITMSVFASLLLIYSGSLLAPIIVHFLWYGIGGIVFGVVSLAGDYPSIWNSLITGNDLISGSFAKLDGSIIMLFVNILLIIFMSILIKRMYTIGHHHNA